MKMKFRLLIVLLVLVFTRCVNFKATKIDTNIAPLDGNGVVYSLPQTALKVTVTYSKETKVKGPFAEYAEKLLGLKNVIAVNQTNFLITDISIDGMNIADTAHQYLISKGKTLFGCKRTTYGLNQMGALEGLNSRMKPAKDSVSSHFSMAVKQESFSYPDFFKLYADASQIEKIDTVYEIVKMDTVTMSKPIIKRTLVTKTVQQRAEEAADYILKFRIKRYELIAANQEVPYTKEALEFMNNQMVKIENEYLVLFTGITYSESYQVSYMIVPDKASLTTPMPLFNFSSDYGIVDGVENAQQYALAFEPSTSIPVDTLVHKKRTEIPYRNPVSTKISVVLNGEHLPQLFMIPIHQYGVLRYFPSNVKRIVIDEQSGVVRKIVVK